MESGEVGELCNPRHPYTRGLFGCIPNMTADKIARPLMPIRGQLPPAMQDRAVVIFGLVAIFLTNNNAAASWISNAIALITHPAAGVRCAKWPDN